MVPPWALDVDVRLLATVVSSEDDCPSLTTSVCCVGRGFSRAVAVVRSLFTSTWLVVALLTASITGPRFVLTASSVLSSGIWLVICLRRVFACSDTVATDAWPRAWGAAAVMFALASEQARDASTSPFSGAGRPGRAHFWVESLGSTALVLSPLIETELDESFCRSWPAPS